MVNKTRLWIVMIVVLIFAEGCTRGNRPGMTESPTAETHAMMPSSTPGSPALIEAGAHQSTTQNDLTGNHVATGSINILTASVIDVSLEGEPIWLVGAPLNDGVVFVAVMEDGTAQGFKVAGQSYSPVEITPSQLPAGMPPLLTVLNGMPKLVIPPVDSSRLTNPILLDGRLVYIASNGDLVVDNVRLPVNALPDSRILMNEEGHLLVLCEPSIRYDHGVVAMNWRHPPLQSLKRSPNQVLFEPSRSRNPMS